MIRTDAEIQDDIVEELRWDPRLREDDIAVGVRNGVVTLAGYVQSYAENWAGERVASRVKGVRAIVNDLEVRLPSEAQRPDPEIAGAAMEALKWNLWVPRDRITIKVEDGHVEIEGDVDWYFQKEAAEQAVRHLRGVRGVSNIIALRMKPTPNDIKLKIRGALTRGAEFDAGRIVVELKDSKVVLKGTVRSFAEKRNAERAARNAPGVTEVVNDLVVEPEVFASI